MAINFFHQALIIRAYIRLNVLSNMAHRIDFVAFTFGKIVRMGFFAAFAVSLFSNTQEIAGHTRGEVIMFFAVMNLLDVTAQMIWVRGLQALSRDIRLGTFDSVLTKPVSVFWWTALRQFDVFDFVTLPAALAFVWYAMQEIGVSFGGAEALLALIIFACAITISFSCAVLLSAISFYTVEMQAVWFMYRDLLYLARNPPEIFPRVVRLFFTYVFPLFLMVTFPVRAFMGLLQPWKAVWAVCIAAAFLIISRLVWERGVRVYNSASS